MMRTLQREMGHASAKQDEQDLDHNLVTDAYTAARDQAHHARHVGGLVPLLVIRFRTRWAELMVEVVHFGEGPLAYTTASSEASPVQRRDLGGLP